MFYDTYSTLDESLKTGTLSTRQAGVITQIHVYHILKKLIPSILHELLPKVDNVCLPTMQFATIIEDFF